MQGSTSSNSLVVVVLADPEGGSFGFEGKRTPKPLAGALKTAKF